MLETDFDHAKFARSQYGNWSSLCLQLTGLLLLGCLKSTKWGGNKELLLENNRWIMAKFQGHSAPVKALVFSRISSYLFTGSDDQTINYQDSLITQKVVLSHTMGTSWFQVVLIQQLKYVTETASIYTFIGHQQAVNCVIVSGNSDNSLKQCSNI